MKEQKDLITRLEDALTAALAKFKEENAEELKALSEADYEIFMERAGSAEPVVRAQSR